MKVQNQLEPGQSVRIRTANSSDIATIVAITNAAFAIETFLGGVRTDQADVARRMRKGSFLVAEDRSGRIVASVYVELRGARAYFGMLAVDPSQQKTGLGRSMAQAAESHSRNAGCSAMDLTVLSLRPELRPYYRKLGYREMGVEEFRPSRPLTPGVECHCIVMSKAL